MPTGLDTSEGVTGDLHRVGLAAAGTLGLPLFGKTPREQQIERLSDEIFSKGNVHLKNVERLTALPEGLLSMPEVCFIGKPNVGKSSIIACLLHNAKLARAGGTPGSTRLLKFFNVGDAVSLVDTPGYGGWKGRKLKNSPLERTQAFAILFRYLALRRQGKGLKHVYWVMEASARTPIGFQPRDEELLEFLQRERIRFTVVLSKIDRHWRHYQEFGHPQKRGRGAAIEVGKDGIPKLPRKSYDRPRAQMWNSLSGEASFRAGVQRNIEEIHAFLGCDAVPVLGVSANRLQPQRCLYLDALRYDLTRYCVEDIDEDSQLTYSSVKQLSYAPPTADAIQQVQLKYPLASFIVPQDNHLSLEEMVRRHEEGKKRLAAGRTPSFTAAQLAACGLTTPACREKEALLPTSSDAGVHKLPKPADSALLCRTHDISSCREEQKDLALLCDTVEQAAELVGESSPQSVRAINGVMIPWSLVPAVVEDHVEHQTDEITSFASLSGADALASLLHHEMSAEHDPTQRTAFLEHTTEAKVELMDSSPRFAASLAPTARHRSARRKRVDAIVKKYLKGVRKPRSCYLSAEGYMCPWLSASKGDGASAVVGLGVSSRGVGATGSLMPGLKQSGFGGKSYSARTLKHRGRATRKTGRWAA